MFFVSIKYYVLLSVVFLMVWLSSDIVDDWIRSPFHEALYTWGRFHEALTPG